MNTHRVAIVRADGAYVGAGWVTFSGAGRTRSIAVEHADGLGIVRGTYAIDFGDATGTEALRLELTRAGWEVRS